MAKLVFGKNGQVWFNSEEELNEAVDYILNSSNVDFNVYEPNHLSGAWGPEYRIHFFQRDDIPECLLRIMTEGNGSLFGRINCKEFVEYLWEAAKNNRSK